MEREAAPEDISDLDAMGSLNTEECMQVIVVGRLWGTATGWDHIGDNILYFYDFVPEPGVELPQGEGIAFCLEKGVVETYNDEDGSVTWTCDFVPMANALPRIL